MCLAVPALPGISSVTNGAGHQYNGMTATTGDRTDARSFHMGLRLEWTTPTATGVLETALYVSENKGHFLVASN